MLLRASAVAFVKHVQALVIHALPDIAGSDKHVAAIVNLLHILRFEAELAAHKIMGLMDAPLERLPDVHDMLRDENKVMAVMASHRHILGEGPESLPVLGGQILVALVKNQNSLIIRHHIIHEKNQALNVGIMNRAVFKLAPENLSPCGLVIIEGHGEAVKIAVDVGSGNHIARGTKTRSYEHGRKAGYVAKDMAAPAKLGENEILDRAQALAAARQARVAYYHYLPPPLMRALEAVLAAEAATLSITLRRSLTMRTLTKMKTTLWTRRAEPAQRTPGGRPERSSENEGMETPAIESAAWKEEKEAEAATPKP